MNRQEHWDRVYATKAVTDVSWFQKTASMSLSCIRDVHPELDATIADVGAGASTLVDGLLAAGYRQITVLDLAALALDATRARLGAAARDVTWIAGDVLTHAFPASSIDVWHDRAVFHFLTSAADRAAYVAQVRRALRPGGHIIVGTFAADGPQKCSGLDVCRYAPDALHREFGDDFALLHSAREAHITPGGGVQLFQFCTCRLHAHESVPAHGAAA
jgi:SAM-dependent methyltransferase